MTHEEFLAIMALMEEYFEKSLSKSVGELYWKAFKNWSKQDFEKACDRLIRTRVFPGFPKIAEIYEALNGSYEEKVAKAYSVLMDALREYRRDQTVTFDDGAIGHAVEAMGGWEAVHDISPEDWKFKRAEFESLYKGYVLRGMTEPVTLKATEDYSSKEKSYEQLEWQFMTEERSRMNLENVRKINQMLEQISKDAPTLTEEQKLERAMKRKQQLLEQMGLLENEAQSEGKQR